MHEQVDREPGAADGLEAVSIGRRRNVPMTKAEGMTKIVADREMVTADATEAALLIAEGKVPTTETAEVTTGEAMEVAKELISQAGSRRRSNLRCSPN